MIPSDFITEWRAVAPWADDAQIEQDLVISRALVELFSHPLLRDALLFRGGTALYKLYLTPAPRYSEDIDLVQARGGPIGPVIDAMRETLAPWLGEPARKQSDARVTLTYRFQSEGSPPIPLRLKVEINTREHFTHYGVAEVPFTVSSRWFSGETNVPTYTLDELLGTKLRALYQRRKGRDLFDLDIALQHEAVDPARICEAFLVFMRREGHHITRAQFEENLAAKLANRLFTGDIGPLLSGGQEWNMKRAVAAVSNQLIARLPGDPWAPLSTD